jgi:hypothetical protein
MSQTAGMETRHAWIATPIDSRCAASLRISGRWTQKGEVPVCSVALAPLGESPGNLRAWLGVWFWWSPVARQQVVDQV